MILIIWIVLTFTCYAEKNQESSNFIEDAQIKIREVDEDKESSKSVSSTTEKLPTISSISNPAGPQVYPRRMRKDIRGNICKDSKISMYTSELPEEIPPPSPEDILNGLFVNISKEDANNGVQEANDFLQQLSSFESELQIQGIAITDADSPEFINMQYFKNTQKSMEIAKNGFITDGASKAIIKSLQLTADQARVSLPRTVIDAIVDCHLPPICTETDNLYRRHDGGCNNLKRTQWGKSFTPYQRKTQSSYADGISIPRKSVVNGGPLPSARKISVKVDSDVDKPSVKFTISVMQWSQFIEHDITQSSISKYNNTCGIQCCGSSGPLNESQFHPECFPIEVPADDPFYSAFGRRCMNFVRSLPAPNAQCNLLGFRNQMNQVTHYLDASTVYGSTEEDANRLGQCTEGLLIVRPGNFLPEDNSTTVFDFLAGDKRVNFEPHLSVIHTIWLREHNRVAKKLAQLHVSWNDEKIYQETRKIVIAEIQHIVYNEWLPLIIGPAKMTEFGLAPLSKGFFTKYTNGLNPSILNEFDTVAIRFKLTLVQGNLKLYDSKNTNTQTLELSNNFNKPENLISPPEKFDEFARGLYQQPMQEFDNYIVDDLTNKFFKTANDGLDWMALTIQKGRDHGIGTYNVIRSACRLSIAQNFESLSTYMKPKTVAAFKSLYATVQDLDAFIAGISEKPIPGGIVGDTFSCLIAQQFYNLKYGDRFYYENGGLPSSFTSDQLTEIRKVSWARILCDNDQNIKDIQPLAFKLTDTSLNKKVLCSNIAAIKTVDLNKWSNST